MNPITLAPGESVTITAGQQSSGGGGGSGGGGSGGGGSGDGGGSGSGGTTSDGVPIVDMGWGNNRVFVQSLPVALRFRTGNKSSDRSLPFISGAEYPTLGGSPSPRYAVLSRTAGDFTHAEDNAPWAVSGPSNSVSIKFAVGTGNNFGGYASCELDTEFFVNVRDEGGNGGAMFFDLSINQL